VLGIAGVFKVSKVDVGDALVGILYDAHADVSVLFVLPVERVSNDVVAGLGVERAHAQHLVPARVAAGARPAAIAFGAGHDDEGRRVDGHGKLKYTKDYTTMKLATLDGAGVVVDVELDGRRLTCKSHKRENHNHCVVGTDGGCNVSPAGTFLAYCTTHLIAF
jgi:hypothetical protein